METRKQSHQCVCCLTKNDLTVLAADKQKILSSFLHVPAKKFKVSRICINCNSTLSCVDRFRQNSLWAQTILEKCKLKNSFLSSVTDESVSSSFDSILNWMNDVTVILKYYMTDLKEEIKVAEYEEEQEVDEEIAHEEELFVGSVDEENIKKEVMEIEALEEAEDEIKMKNETNSDFEERDYDDDDDEDYFPNEVEEEEKEEKPKVGQKKRIAVYHEPDSDDKSKFRCDLCGKGYAVRQDLMYHMNVHAGVNPFICNIDGCKKSYPHPRTLKVHQREMHNLWNGKPVEKPVIVNKDPAFEKKLDEFRDENFVIENYYLEARKGLKRPYQCTICSKYYNKTEFQYHRFMHLGLKPFKCSDCDKTYSNPFELSKHFKKAHETNSESDDDDRENVKKEKSDDENEPIRELTPNESMRDTNDDTQMYRDLEKYFVDERRGCRRAYECPDCKKLYSRGELKYHLNTHKNIKPYACAVEDCDKSFSSPRDMRVHALKFHKIKVKPTKDYSMKNSRNSIKREKSERPLGVEYNKINVICTVCGKSVRKKHFREHYQTHIKTDFSCPYENQGCPEVFKNRAKLTSHIQAKHDPEYTPLAENTCMCEHCGKRLTKAQLKYHMNLHLGLTPYACEYADCNEAYRSPNLLRQHIAGYHLKQMRFKCHYCSKRFNTKEEQEEHKKETCGVKTATCHMCGKTMNKFSLKNHLLVHTGEKNWVCEVEGCGKAFIRRDKLQQHKKVHSTDDHYMCQYCNTGFRYKSWLDTHIEKKHTDIETIGERITYQIVDN